MRTVIICDWCVCVCGGGGGGGGVGGGGGGGRLLANIRNLPTPMMKWR